MHIGRQTLRDRSINRDVLSNKTGWWLGMNSTGICAVLTSLCNPTAARVPGFQGPFLRSGRPFTASQNLSQDVKDGNLLGIFDASNMAPKSANLEFDPLIQETKTHGS